MLAGVLGAALPAQASVQVCGPPPRLDAAGQARLLRLTAAVHEVLAASGAQAALVARSGLALARFGQRHSHAGVALAAHPLAPWSVRQLYLDCDSGRPRLFDQGLAAFVFGQEAPERGSVLVLPLPGDAGAAVARTALHDPTALALLAGQYSASAHPFATRYQNCNQWVAELLAAAWGGAADRPSAQRWLAEAGYAPSVFAAGPATLLAALFVPQLHRDDHPEADLAAGRLRISMPQSLAGFVARRLPQARAVALCVDGDAVRVRPAGVADAATGCSAG